MGEDSSFVQWIKAITPIALRILALSVWCSASEHRNSANGAVKDNKEYGKSNELQTGSGRCHGWRKRLKHWTIYKVD